MKKTFFYKLIDPRRPDIPKYIGRADSPGSRLIRHIRDATKDGSKHTPKSIWIKTLLDSGIRPEIVVIDELEYSYTCEWSDREMYHIAKHFYDGFPLENASPGGVHPINHNIPHTAKISTSQIKVMTDEEIKAILTGEKAVNGILSIALQNALTIELSERAIKKASKPHWSVVPSLIIGFTAMVAAGIAAYFAVYPRSPQPASEVQKSVLPAPSVQHPVSSSRKQLYLFKTNNSTLTLLRESKIKRCE